MYNLDRYLLYLETRVVPQLSMAGNPRSIVVIASVPAYQQDPRVRRLIEAAGSLLIYCPVGALDLNPIMSCFRRYHSVVKEQLSANDSHPHFHALIFSCSHADMCDIYRETNCIRNVPDPVREAARRREHENCRIC